MKKQPLSPTEVQHLTGRSIEHLVNLTGIKGIQPDFDPHLAKFFETDNVGNEIKVEIRNTPYLNNLRLRINFGEIKFIIIDEIRKNKSFDRKHIARDTLDSMVSYAREDKYKYLSLHAFGSENDPDWQGYFIWAKYGFLISENNPTEEIYIDKLKLAVSKGIISDLKVTELNELIEDKKFLDWWVLNGCDWKGTFNLNNRVSLRILDKACGREFKRKKN